MNPTNPYDVEAPDELQARSTISGVVRANIAGDGERPLVENAQVTITLSDGSDVDDTTDENGAFVIANIRSGNARIVVTHPDFQAHSGDLATFAPGEERTDVTIFLSPFTADGNDLALVTGTVLKDLEEDNHGGIVVRDVDDPTFFGVTNPDGVVQFRIAPGPRELVIDEYGYTETTFSVDASTDAATSFGEVVIPFVPGRVLGVIAVESPAVAQSISVSLDLGGVDQVTADGSGNYAIPGVPLGTYRLTAFADGHEAIDVAGVNVTPGDDTTVEPIFLRRARGSISGVARFSPGFDADNSGIVVSVAGTSALATTDVDGNYLIENVPTNAAPGYTLNFQADDFLNRSVAGVVVTKNATTPVNEAVVLAKQIGDFEIIPSPYTATADVVLRLAPIPLGAVTLRVSESNDFTGIDYAPFPVDGGGAIVTDVPYTITGDDGQVTLYVQYEIDDDSEAGPFSSSVVLDRIAPVVSALTLDGGAAVTNGNSVSVDVVATDATGVTRYEVSEDIAFTNPAETESNVIGQPLAFAFADSVNDGERTLHVRVYDLAGNVSDVVSTTITRDTTPPALVSFSIDCNSVIDADECKDTTVQLTIDAPDAVEWFVSEAQDPQPRETDWNSFQVTPSVSGLLPGERTLYLKIRDAAKNENAVPFSDSIIIDTTAPTAASVVIDSGAAFIGTGRTTAELTLFALGATQMRISADPDTTDDPVVAYAPSTTVTLPTPLVEGPLGYYATFLDAAGNEVTVSDGITVDTTAPSPGPLPITIDGQATYTASLSVTLSLDADDAVEMQLVVDDTSDVVPATVSDWVPFASTTLTLLPAGDCSAASGACKQVCVRFRDAALNESDGTDCAAIALDATPPAATIIVSAPDVVSARQATLVLAEQPADANFSTYEILITPGGQGFTPVNASPTSPPTFVVALEDAGGEVSPEHLNKTEYLVRIRAVDDGGNIGPEATRRIVYDEWDPTAPAIRSTATTVNANTFSLLLDGTTNTADDDATFANYEVAQISCDGFQRAVCESAGEPATFTQTAQTDGIFFTLDQGLATGCRAPCVNRLFIRAVDEAGNIGPASSVIIDEDSTSPTKPKMVPKFASVYGERAVMRVEAGATDDTAVSYQVRGGLFDSYNNFATEEGGIVSVPLIRNEVNEICIRAVDEAGNVSVEECSVITQEDQITFALEDDIDFLHLEDNYISFIADRERMQLQDVRTNIPIDIGGPIFFDKSAFVGVPPNHEISHGSIAVHDGALHIGFIGTGRSPGGGGGDFFRWAGFREIPLTNGTLIPAPGEGCDFPGVLNADCLIGAPYNWNLNETPPFVLDEDARIFVGEGFVVVRQKDLDVDDNPNNAFLHVEFTKAFGDIGASPSVTLRAMPPDTDLCLASEVVMTETAPGEVAFVWCETDDNETGTVYRRTVTVTEGGGNFTYGLTRLETLGATSVEQPDLFDGSTRFNQPVMTSTTTYWIENGELRALDHDESPGADINVDPTLDGTIKRLARTVGGERLSMVRFSGEPQTSPAYVYTYDLDPTSVEPLRQITNGLVTPYDAVVDGPRVMWADRSTLSSTAYFQSLGEIQWQAHGPQITAFPSTDGRFTTYIDGREGNLGFYAFDDIEGLEFLVTEELALEGLGEEGRATAGATTLWVRRTVADLFQLTTSDLEKFENGLPAECPVPLVGGGNAAIPQRVIAIDDTGSLIAFAQGTQIYLTQRTGECDWGAPTVVATILGDRVKDISVLDLGAPMIVWTEDADDRDRTYFSHGARGGQISEQEDQGFGRYFPLSVELSEDDGRAVFAARYFFDDSGILFEDLPPSNEGILFCSVAETGTQFCENGELTALPRDVLGGEIKRPAFVTNGLLVVTESGPNFAGTSHLTVIDTRTARMRSLLPAFYGDFAAQDQSGGGGDFNPHVSFSSTRLGAVDVWKADVSR